MTAPEGGRSERVAQAQQVAARHGAQLRPVHPGTADPDLARFFVAEIDPDHSPEQAARDLLACDAIESAVAKPMDEPP
jgi:hypothetical protein